MADTLQIWPHANHRKWKDGDPFCLWLGCQVLRENAWRLIRDQYAKNAALYKPYLDVVGRKRFTVLSRTELEAELLVEQHYGVGKLAQTLPAGTKVRIGKKPNEYGVHCNVPEFLEGALARGKIQMFRLGGKQVFFEETEWPTTDAMASAIWDVMEVRTPHLRTNNRSKYLLDERGLPCRDQYLLLNVEVQVHTEAEQRAVLEPEREQIGVDPDTGEPIYRIVKMRKKRIDWENLPTIDSAARIAVRDKRQALDYRGRIGTQAKTIIREKS